MSNSEILKEIGERLKNGEELLSIKADLNSRNIKFDQFEDYSKSNLNAFDFIKFGKNLQKVFVGLIYILSCSQFLYNLFDIPRVLLYQFLILLNSFFYYKILRKHLEDIYFELNKFFRIIILLLLMYYISTSARFYPQLHTNLESDSIINSVDTK
jgi:hypothetical protein